MSDPPSTGVSLGCSLAAYAAGVGYGCDDALLAVLDPIPPNADFAGCTWNGLCLVGAPTYQYGACPLCAAPDNCRAALNASIAGAGAACAGAADALALALLRDQGSAVCAASTAGQAAGAASLGAQLTQCRVCGVVPCPAGWLCAEDQPPRACPAGYSCAAGAAEAVRCPSGSFCAAGDALAPVACRATAFGSCAGGGAERERVWVPALLALAAIALVRLVTLALERRRRAAAAKALGVAPMRAAAHVKSVDLDLPTAPASSSGEDPGGGPSPSNDAADDDDDDAAVAAAAAAPAAESLCVDFRDLSLETRGVRRLDCVSGRLAPARVTAILGGSGAGKTTLLNVLLGKDAPTGGDVRAVVLPRAPSAAAATTISRRRGASRPADGGAALLSPAQLRRALGFVPQTDVLLDELTAREIVAHAAAARLPRAIRGRELEERVDAALAALNLARRAHALAGELSASDRKRLSIATELVAEPLLLVLDEPTTGLDSSSALGVVERVRAVAAARGLTVAAVLHQPRPEIFALVDELVLLARGGRPVFLGPRALALRYFEEVLGFAPPADTAAADFIMDAMQGACGPVPCAGGAGGAGARDPVAVAVALAAAWRERGAAWVAREREGAAAVEAATADDKAGALALASGAAAAAAAGAGARRQWAAPPRRGPLALLALYFVRAVRQRLRGGATTGTLVGFFLGGCVAGLVFSGGPLYVAPAAWYYANSCPPDGLTFCVNPQSSMYQPGPFYQCMIVGALAVPTAVRTLGGERAHAWREAGVGANRVAYFFGVLLADALLIWPLCALAFTGPMVLIAPLRGPEGNFALLAYATVAVCSGIAHAVSAATGTQTELATLTGVILAVVLNLFGGFVPMVGSDGQWAYTHWAQRAFATNELLLGYSVTRELYDTLVPEEWESPDFHADVGYLFAIAALTALLALALTVGLNRDKQR